MKATAGIIIMSTFFSLLGCKAQKEIIADSPYTFGSATCQHWSGGRAEAGSGLLLTIPVNSILDEGYALKQAFFRGKVANMTLKDNNGVTQAEANFKKGVMVKPDIVMHKDPKMETGNKPALNKGAMGEFPFELEPNEAMLSFEKEGKLAYYKVTGIKEMKPLIYK